MSNRQYTIYTKEGNVKLSTINENEAWFNLDREAGDTIDIQPQALFNEDYSFDNGLVDFRSEFVVYCSLTKPII
jgi:hypothetical protein